MGRRNPPRRDNKPDQKALSQLRIIAGDWRGRKLDFIPLEGVRPTPDRVRETLFNWLQAYVPGARCLDLFAGSGALGLEALSRGAESVTFIDREPAVAFQLRSNLQKLKCQQAEVIQEDTLSWLEKRITDMEPRYDLVFLDPPFRKGMLQRCCQLLEQHNMLADNAMIYIECESELALHELPSQWQEQRNKTAGQVSYRLLQRQLEE